MDYDEEEKEEAAAQLLYCPASNQAVMVQYASAQDFTLLIQYLSLGYLCFYRLLGCFGMHADHNHLQWTIRATFVNGPPLYFMMIYLAHCKLPLQSLNVALHNINQFTAYTDSQNRHIHIYKKDTIYIVSCKGQCKHFSTSFCVYLITVDLGNPLTHTPYSQCINLHIKKQC